jgi:hypothetical protein
MDFTIFFRTSTEHDKRRRWHKMSTVKAASRPAALRKITSPMHGAIDRTTSCVLGEDGILYLAHRSDRIDFEHYDFNGTFVPVEV